MIPKILACETDLEKWGKTEEDVPYSQTRLDVIAYWIEEDS
jgi:hypothetical protein